MKFRLNNGLAAFSKLTKTKSFFLTSVWTMITICKHHIYSHWKLAIWTPMFSKVGDGVSCRQGLRKDHKEPGSLVLFEDVYLPHSWEAVGSVGSSGSVWREKGCLGGESRLKSRLFAHVQSRRMDEDTDGISLCWTGVFGQTWKPGVEWTGISLKEGRLSAFHPNRAWKELLETVKVVCVDRGVCWDEVNI